MRTSYQQRAQVACGGKKTRPTEVARVFSFMVVSTAHKNKNPQLQFQSLARLPLPELPAHARICLLTPTRGRTLPGIRD